MHCHDYLTETRDIAIALDAIALEAFANELHHARVMRGRIFVIGIGGSAANAMHMAADLRKLCDCDALSFDNLAELTARTNDEGWASIFTGWLWNRISDTDILLVLSVGGGTEEVSTPIVNAIRFAKERGALVLGIVGPDGGYTAKHANHVIRIPAPSPRVTPHTEGFQAVLWHALVSHPLLQRRKTVW